MSPDITRIGLVSDTHGLLRPQAAAALAGCAHIVHAGDIGGPDILRRLAELAPLTAVRGNNDRDDWALALPEATVLEVGGRRIGVVHEIALRRRHPLLRDLDVLVYGHSHRPQIARAAGELQVNPGSAGPRRFSLPVTIGFLEIGSSGPEARIDTLRV